MTTDRFKRLRALVRPILPGLVTDMLPRGRREGRHWVALNPTRADRRLGSFKINLTSGAWRDYATGDGGGDLVSLYAYLYGLSQGEALRLIERRAGVRNDR